MHVNVLEVQNYMKVDAFKVEANGKHVVISAANDSGKSSVVNALFDGINGINTKEHPDPVRHGADKAVIKIKTDQYIIERQIKPDGKSSLVVKTLDGKKVAGMTPQKLLDGLISEYSLDPVQFWFRRPQDQIDDVLKICGINPPVEKVEAITGEPCPALPNETADKYLERLSADNTGLYYTKRRLMNQEVETCRGAVEKQQQLVGDINLPEVLIRPVENIMSDIDTCNLQAEVNTREKTILVELEKEHAAYEIQFKEIESDIVAAGKQRTAIKMSITVDEAEITQLMNKITDLQTRIRLKQTEMNTLQDSVHQMTQRLEKGTELIEQQTAKIHQQQDKITALPDVESNRKMFTEELKQHQKHNDAAVKYNAAVERLDVLKSSHEDAKSKHTALDTCLERLRDLRRNLLNDIDLGIEGLSIGEGELLLNGVSFKQASSSQKLAVAFCIAIKGNPALKLIRIDNGELLDHNSQSHLLKLASESGYQVIMTRVNDQQGLQVEIIDV